MWDINSITALVILVLPLLIDLLKRIFPMSSENVVKVVVGIVSILAALIVDLSQNPVLNLWDLVKRSTAIFLLAQVAYDKIWASTQVSKTLSGEK